jgi:peroxiredoxin
MSDETTTAPRTAGNFVADFELNGTDGETYDSLTARGKGLLLAVLFKTGCGTCKYSLPFLQRFHELYALPSNGEFQVWGISQDDPVATRASAAENGNATFPILIDDELSTTVRYGVTHVPDFYLLGAEDTILAAILGHFSADGLNELARRIADFTGLPYTPIVRAEDNAPALKPG